MTRLGKSLRLKLILAFLLVGVLGLVTFALLVGLRTNTEFRRFLSARDRAGLVATLEQYYADNGSWAGVERVLREGEAMTYARDAVVFDLQGRVVHGGSFFAPGAHLMPHDLARGLPLEVAGETVGYVRFMSDTMGEAMGGSGMRRGMMARSMPMEADFFRRVLWAVAGSAAVTVAVALLTGSLLAGTLTQPLRSLTAATQAMTRGELGQQVKVQTADEIGELAASFNQMSRDLQRASHLRKQMTADLAHDLRTPLSIIHGYMEGLKEGRLEGNPTLYAILYEEVEHLERLVDDLRVLSLADAGELPLKRRAVDPAALLERTGLAYLDAAQRAGVGLRVETAEPLPSVFVDTDRITQVLNNLVSNALRHTQTGEIVLAAAALPDQVELRVRDTGAGIAPDELPFVFDRFYRVDKARRRTGPHTIGGASSGLGLAIAKAIVEAHGGSIGVVSGVEQGTTFTLRLPLARDAEPAPLA